MLQQYTLKHKTRKFILSSFPSIPVTSLLPLSFYFLYFPFPPFFLQLFLLACVHSARIARFSFSFLFFIFVTPSLMEQRRWIKSFPTTAWLVRLLVKTKLALPKGVFFWVFICVYVSRREKEVGRRNEYFTPSFSFTCFPTFSLTLSLFLSFVFYKGSHVVMKSFWLEKHSTHSFKITEM